MMNKHEEQELLDEIDLEERGGETICPRCDAPIGEDGCEC
jgi:hypothetical protein